jgi:hypothetical protein
MCEQAGQAEDAASIGDDSHVQPFVTDDSDEDDFLDISTLALVARASLDQSPTHELPTHELASLDQSPTHELPTHELASPDQSQTQGACASQVASASIAQSPTVTVGRSSPLDEIQSGSRRGAAEEEFVEEEFVEVSLAGGREGCGRDGDDGDDCCEARVAGQLRERLQTVEHDDFNACREAWVAGSDATGAQQGRVQECDLMASLDLRSDFDRRGDATRVQQECDMMASLDLRSSFGRRLHAHLKEARNRALQAPAVGTVGDVGDEAPTVGTVGDVDDGAGGDSEREKV